MITCHHCGKEVKADKNGNITIAFIEQIHMTIDFPFCNDKCYRKLMIERGYDKPKCKWEREFKIKLLQEEIKDNKLRNKELKEGINLLN